MEDTPAVAVLDRTGLDTLIRLLVSLGRTVVGPTVRDGAVVLLHGLRARSRCACSTHFLCLNIHRS
ncbi:hypothetical protein OG735_09250 [Streptomyces sp. NBC_01210]|nr:hypothetical protein OG735_09250 [Streptomyces sp. NBC_01210]